MISQDDQLTNGFNAVGFSQGGQFLSVTILSSLIVVLLNVIISGGH